MLQSSATGSFNTDDWLYDYVREINLKTYDPKYMIHEFQLLKDQNSLLSSLKSQISISSSSSLMKETMGDEEDCSLYKRQTQSTVESYLKTQSQVFIGEDSRSGLSNKLTNLLKEAEKSCNKLMHQSVRELIYEYKQVKKELDFKTKQLTQSKKQNYILKHQLSLVREKIHTSRTDSKYKNIVQNQSTTNNLRKEQLLIEKQMALAIKEKAINSKQRTLNEKKNKIKEFQVVVKQMKTDINKILTEILLNAGNCGIIKQDLQTALDRFWQYEKQSVRWMEYRKLRVVDEEKRLEKLIAQISKLDPEQNDK